MKHFTLTFILCILFTLHTTAQSNWPMVSGSAARTAWVDTEELQPPLKLQYNIGWGAEFMIKYENVMYFGNGGSPNTVKALDLNLGEELWKFEIPGSAGSIGVAPAVSGDKVFVGGQNGLGLYALNRHTGEEEWLKPIGSLFSRCPITDGLGHVYITAGDSLFCINENDGSTLWASPESQGYYSPTFYDNKVFFDNSQKLIALDALTGNVIWQVMHISGPRSHILIDESDLYICRGSEICAYNTDDGSEIWCYSLPNGDAIASFTEGSATISENVLCYTIWENSEGKGQLVALNKLTGQKMWDYTSDTYGISAPTAGGNTVYVTGYGNSWVRGFDANTGSIVFEKTDQPYWFQPIIADERLYVNFGGGTSVFRADQTTDVLNTKNEEFNCFPNPFDQILTINLKEEIPDQILITDINGKNVFSKNSPIDQHTLDIPTDALIPGIYFLTLWTKDERITKMIIKATW